MEAEISYRVLQHLRSVGFDELQAKAFLKRLSRWVRYSGTEWATQRLKSLKGYHLRQLEGDKTPPIPTGWAVYQTRKRKVFKDPFVRMVMDLPNSGASLLKKEAFLRIPTVFLLKETSKCQMSKFMEAVTGPYNGSQEALSIALDAIDKGFKLLMDRIDPEKVQKVPFKPLMNWATNEKRAPVLADHDVPGSFHLYRHVTTKSRMHAEAYNFATYLSSDRVGQTLWRTYPFDVSKSMVGAGEAIFIQSYSYKGMKDHPAGKIGLLQEGGCKLRSVANPFLALQALGEPLKRKLEYITSCIPAIGVFDQSSSHDTIVRWLLGGKEVASFDLTSFTDRFPYILQERVLSLALEKKYVTQFDIDVMKMVVNKEWVLPGTVTRVKWEVGQPLGFGPSFHLATLTHTLLLAGLCNKANLYQVVGDDVAICDPLLARRYSDLITELGVEISQSKSLVSRSAAEFCGKTLTAEGISPSIKVRLISGADQLVKLLDFYGPRAISFLSEKERKWLLKVTLPEDLGGLGWSLPGQKYADWLNNLHTDRIAYSRIRADLKEFLRADVVALEESYKFAVSFAHVNNLVTDSEGMLGMSPKGVAGISATNLFTHGRVEGPSGVHDSNNFMYLSDKAASFTLQNLSKLSGLLKSTEIDDLIRRYFNKHGYINPSEKKCELPITESRSIPNHGRQVHNQYTRYLKTTSSGRSEGAENRSLGSTNSEVEE